MMTGDHDPVYLTKSLAFVHTICVAGAVGAGRERARHDQAVIDRISLFLTFLGVPLTPAPGSGYITSGLALGAIGVAKAFYTHDDPGPAIIEYFGILKGQVNKWSQEQQDFRTPILADVYSNETNALESQVAL